MATFLTSLAITLITVGLMEQAEKARRLADKKKGIDNQSVSKIVNEAIGKARSKGSQALTKVMDKISNMPVPNQAIGNLKDHLMKTYGDLNKKKSHISKTIDSIEEKIVTLEGAKNEYNMDPSGMKDKTVKDKIEKASEEITDMAKQFEEEL